MSVSLRELIDFWMAQPGKRLFAVDRAFDAELADRFGVVHARAAAGRLDAWRDSVDGRLALVLLLDQLSRNLHRDTPAMFANDAQALELANLAIAAGDAEVLPRAEMRWHVMAFMHSERLEDQQKCLQLCRDLELADTEPHAVEHHDIIARFGRFPHRNKLLGRHTTPKEQSFLDGGGFAG